MAKFEEAVTAYREALKEWIRERVPLQWAMSVGNQGIGLMYLARREDAAMAEAALGEINTAFEAMREGGHMPYTALFKQQLPIARRLRRR
jgi:hypothetical protein